MGEVTERSKRIRRTEFTRGDRVVAVRWLHRFAGDTSRLTFVKDAYRNETDYDVVNSTELRAVGFSMKKVRLPDSPHVCTAITRSSTRNSGEPGGASATSTTHHYVLDRADEDGILMQSW